MRAHKFSLVWLGGSVADLSKLRAGYIGSERIGHTSDTVLPSRPKRIVQQLAERDHSRAAILCKYFVEMKTVLAEIHRVLRNNSAAMIIVGTSLMRGTDVQTHCCLTDIAASIGFDVVGVVRRMLDRNKRMMPARFGKKTDSMIEQRMHEEYVIGLLKSDMCLRPTGGRSASSLPPSPPSAAPGAKGSGGSPPGAGRVAVLRAYSRCRTFRPRCQRQPWAFRVGNTTSRKALTSCWGPTKV